MTQSHSFPLLRQEDLHEDPIVQFTRWLDAAASGLVSQPLAATLASVGIDGRPLARTVLLKYYDSKGFVFFTHLGSRKVRQMAENSNVSLLFPWLPQNRQVNIAGQAQQLGGARSSKMLSFGRVEWGLHSSCARDAIGRLEAPFWGWRFAVSSLLNYSLHRRGGI